MIHQLILSTLFACQQEADVVITTPTLDQDAPVTSVEPLTDPEETETKTEISKPEDPKPITSAQIIITHKLSPVKAANDIENLYANPVHLSYIPPKDSYTDDQFCSYICSKAYASGPRYLRSVENCRLELLTNWEEQRENFYRDNILEKEDLVVGNVECNAKISYFRKGRSAISDSHGSETGSDLGGYFARAAQEERISVFAFQEMLENLSAFSAPKQLLDDCERAICDEQRHTMMMSAFAKRHGANSIVVKLPTQKKVSIFELAKHNAVAGCIEETWSALVAQCQAKHTTQFAKLFEIIAADEIFHAQLSWDIHQWLMTQLSAIEQTEIQNLMVEHLKEWSPSNSDNGKNSTLGEMNTQLEQTVSAEFSSRLAKQARKSVA